LSVAFENRSAGEISSVRWDFGDGASSTALAPTHVYTTPGVYDVALTVTGPYGSDTASKTAFIEATPETTPPTVTSVSPAEGATNVATGTAVTAVFSEAMDAASITSATFELRDAGNSLVPAAVSYAAATRTATLTPSSALRNETTYRALVRGGASGVKDLAGNALGSDLAWSFTTAPAGSSVCATPCSLWDQTVVPSVLDKLDTNAVELGVKFRSDVDGFITGLRFYKGAQNTGTHVGRLWTSSGQLLGQATFVNETPSGWQQVNFATPVAISANTVYVASYHTPVGHYSIDEGYLASAYTNGPLSALASGAAGGNGVYRYGSGGFPTETWNASNYWVDVVFSDVGGSVAPEAGFTMSTTEGVAPLTVAFTDTSTGKIDSWAWDFADGTTSTQPSPSHTFTQPGSYAVTLEISGPGGVGTASAVVTVAAPPPAPVAEFVESGTTGVAPLAVTFSDQSSGEIDSWKWDFGDGGTSSAAQAVWTYQVPGTYTVSLTVSGPGGSDTLTKQQLISVSGLAPVADFAASTRSGTAPLSVAFENRSAGEISSVRWDFGDGKSSTELAPTHVYTEPGVYDVALTVTGPYGSDTASKTAFIQVTSEDPSSIEVGEVVVDHEWQWVEFARPFVAPIVVANPPSANDAEPALVRISGVESTGFWIRIQEWDYLDGIHGFETVSYLVMEQGSHLLPNGERVEAGQFIQGGRALSSIGFAESFSAVPVVLASVTSANDGKAVTSRVHNVSPTGFQLRLDEQESITTGHGAETIHYIAWQPSEGTFEGLRFAVRLSGNSLTHKVSKLSFGGGWNQVPAFLAHMQTINGGDPAALRYRNRTAEGVDIWVQEEQSRDLDTRHAKEAVGWIIFGESD
jgi:PKD repeat protein